MINRVYVARLTADQTQAFDEGKLYVGLHFDRVYTYEQLVKEYKMTKYISIDDYMMDNAILSIGMLKDSDWYWDITYYPIDENNYLLIVAICN